MGQRAQLRAGDVIKTHGRYQVNLIKFEVGKGVEVSLELDYRPDQTEQVVAGVQWSKDRYRRHVKVLAGPLVVHVNWKRRQTAPESAQLPLEGAGDGTT